MVECAAYGGVGDNLPLDTKGPRVDHPFANAIKKKLVRMGLFGRPQYSIVPILVEELQLSSNWL
jgi:hypothetical protein